MDRFFIILCVIIALIIIWKIAGLLSKLYVMAVKADNDEYVYRGTDNG